MILTPSLRSSSRFPVWVSLAKDYLSIMGSSVSSERAFSSARITIAKRRNRLQADIVGANRSSRSRMRKGREGLTPVDNEAVFLRGNNFLLAFSEFRFVQLNFQLDKSEHLMPDKIR